MRQILFGLGLCSLLLCAAPDARASYFYTCNGKVAKWASNAYTARAHTGFSANPWRQQLQSAINKWSNNPSALNYAVTYGATTAGEQNGQSEIFWVASSPYPAVTKAWLKLDGSCTYQEADVEFNVQEPYTVSGAKSDLLGYGGRGRPFQTTAIHELGHAGGLGHTANSYSVMGQDFYYLYTNGAASNAYVGADASASMVALYGLWASGPEDLMAVHWRWAGNASGEYANICRTRVLSATGAVLPLASGYSCAGLEPYYRVSRGQTIQLEMTYENVGKSAKAAYVGFYVSADPTISTADQFIAYSTVSLPRTTALTAAARLVVPTNLIGGRTYWVGAIVDYTGGVAERDESNNASYVGIYVN